MLSAMRWIRKNISVYFSQTAMFQLIITHPKEQYGVFVSERTGRWSIQSMEPNLSQSFTALWKLQKRIIWSLLIMCSISWKKSRNTWMTGTVPFWKSFCPGQKNFRQKSANLKYWWLQSSYLKMTRYSLFCVYPMMLPHGTSGCATYRLVNNRIMLSSLVFRFIERQIRALHSLFPMPKCI